MSYDKIVIRQRSFSYRIVTMSNLFNSSLFFVTDGNEKIVFIGDPITDCERVRPIGDGTVDSLGRSYVSIVNSMLTVMYPTQDILIVNMCISGNTTRDLVERWKTDVLDLKPDWLTMDRVQPNMIGHLIIARAWLNAMGFEWS